MNRLRVICAWLLLTGLTGCVPMDTPNGPVSSGFLGERRSPEAAIEDNMLAMKLRSYYMRHDKVSFANINVSVYQGVVLLTGTASSQEEIDTALGIAKATRGVVRVHSELKVQQASFGEVTKDAWYTNEVKIRLLADEQVRGLDVHVETTKGVVYLTGMAQSVAERNRAIEVARQVKGVREVVSYIEVNPKAQPVTSTPAKDAGPPQTPAPVRYGETGAGQSEKVALPPSPEALPPVKPGSVVEGGF